MRPTRSNLGSKPQHATASATRGLTACVAAQCCRLLAPFASECAKSVPRDLLLNRPRRRLLAMEEPYLG
jgi:hypothetical protein